ncbi:hypothetical protein K7H08_03465 [Halomonas sp. IOP_6]|uniref:hypothetical protein n=1 Tax=Halomonas sp. IOP_6 TaxID=2876583 RepID=UPI001E644477|nr:hypothetical protein [Halomonas sp. IOP_6]MCD6003893.1 hypothetical protein [Halomonas sp. IOP_6]
MEGQLMIRQFFKKPKPEVVLHVGMNKTGTTALQSYLQHISGQLAKHGILYPNAGRIGAAHYSLSASLGFCNPGVPSEWLCSPSKLLKSLESEITSDTRQVIISSEDFLLNKSFNKLNTFFESYPLKVIVYLRRHDHWWLSAYAQAVKMKHLPPWNRGPYGFINFQQKKNPRYGDYRYLIDRWADAVGRENIIVRPYEFEQNQPDLASDFLSSIGQQTLISKLPTMAQRDNVSLPIRSLQLMDTFQRVNTSDAVRAALLSHAKQVTSEDTQNNIQDMLKPEFRIRLVEDQMKTYRYIAETYLGRESGQLFYEPLPTPNSEWRGIPWPSHEEVAQHVIDVMEQLNG